MNKEEKEELKREYRTVLWTEAYKLQKEKTGLITIEDAFEEVSGMVKRLLLPVRGGRWTSLQKSIRQKLCV
jgi:hypothetical protein